MTMPLGSQTITLGITGYFNAPTMGLKGLIIGNESPYTLSVTVGIGQTKTLYPETVDFFTTGPGFNGNVTYIPSGVLTNPTSYTASTITFDAVGAGENIDTSVYPLALTRPAVNPTATGVPLFSTFFGLGSSVGNNQSLNVFNPANSGVIMTFHSAKAFTNSSGIPTANLIYLSGADLNFSGSAGAKSHAGTATPPVSVAHVTTDDSNSGFGGTAIEVARLPGSVVEGTIDLLAFPDNVTLQPGGNLRLSIADTTNAHTTAITLKWSENILTPPLAVTGANAVASSIQNDGSSLATQWLEITPTGQSSSAIVSTVDGQLTAKVVQGGVYHQWAKTQSSGNPLQLGQAGDITEFLGQLNVDQLLNAVGNLAVAGNTTITGTTGLTGLLTAVAANFSGRMQPNQSPTTVNGSTAGTLVFSTPVWGSGLKILVIEFNGFNNAGVVSFNFPSTANGFIAFLGNVGSSTWAFFNSGVQINGIQVTGLGAAGAAGTDSSQANLHSDNLVWIFNSGGLTQIQINPQAIALTATGFAIGF